MTRDIKQDQFQNLINATPRLLSGDNPPDLIRLPTMVSLVKDGLLKNLDGYAVMGSAGTSGQLPSLPRTGWRPTAPAAGSYAMGLNYSLTGVFYNKQLAAQIGLTEPPATVADFDAALDSAKAKGILPIMVWNASASGGISLSTSEHGGLRPTQPINDWIFQKSGATIDTPSNKEAADHLRRWISAGYFLDGRQRDPVHGRELAVPGR